MLKSSARWSGFPVITEQRREVHSNICGHQKRLFFYLIKKIDGDVIEKGHISPSVSLSVHRLLGRLQKTPQPDALVHVCLCHDDHSPGALVLLLFILLLIGVTSRRQSSPSPDSVSDGAVPKPSFTRGWDGHGERRQGERQAGDFCCGREGGEADLSTSSLICLPPERFLEPSQVPFMAWFAATTAGWGLVTSSCSITVSGSGFVSSVWGSVLGEHSSSMRLQKTTTIKK